MSSCLNLSRYLTLVITVIILNSCDPVIHYNYSIVVENQAEKEMIIYVKRITADSAFLVSLPAKSMKAVEFSNIGLFSIGGQFDDIYELFIYNVEDSTYVSFENHHLLQSNESTVINDFFEYSESSSGKGNKRLPEYEFKYTVNDYLLSYMTKNTALTDSIFRLK